MIRKNEHVNGELEVICDECEAEMASGDVMYEYEKDKWCCEDCLQGLFKIRIAQDFIDDYKRAEILGDDPRQITEMWMGKACMGKAEREREDQEQLEYLKIWREEKEREQAEKMERRRVRRMHLRFALSYMKAAVEEVALFFKLLFVENEGKI